MIGRFSLYQSATSIRRVSTLCSSTMSTPTPNVTTPWVPSIHGHALPTLQRLLPVLENSDTPSVKRDPQWLRSTVRKCAGTNPNAEAPLWETVLGLWRLSQVETCNDHDVENSLWAEYVRAWLVHHGVLSSGNTG